MNREDVVQMMHEVGAKPYARYPSNYDLVIDVFERFAALVAAAEREACAKVCEGMARAVGDDMMSAAQWTAASCAAAIRARGQEPTR